LPRWQLQLLSGSLSSRLQPELELEPDIKNIWISGKPEPDIWCIFRKHCKKSLIFSHHLVATLALASVYVLQYATMVNAQCWHLLEIVI